MKKTRYRLKEKCSGHATLGKWFYSGDVIETEIDLIAKYPAKFELESEYLARSQKAVVAKPARLESNASEETEAKAEVTDAEPEKSEPDAVKYPFADEAGLEVVELGRGWFNVVDPDDGDKVVNGKKLREGDLEEFVNNYVNGME